MNWANQNAQGTRPRVVGQLSELFPQYRKECGDGEEISIGGWERWYSERYPDSIDEAADKIFHQMEHLKGTFIIFLINENIDAGNIAYTTLQQ